MTNKIIICGCARNIVNFWTNTSKNLQIIFDSVEDYKCIIIESNSRDNSLEVLNEWSKNICFTSVKDRNTPVQRSEPTYAELTAFVDQRLRNLQR
jgi:hypothetical protein